MNTPREIKLKAIMKSDYLSDDDGLLEDIRKGNCEESLKRFKNIKLGESYYTYSQPLTLGDLQESGGQFDWDDGSYLMFNEVDWKEELFWVQSTGIEDKNGIEIWNGDILRQGKFNDFVKWYLGSFWWNMLEGADMCNSNLEVVGNVYQNFELITNSNIKKLALEAFPELTPTVSSK